MQKQIKVIKGQQIKTIPSEYLSDYVAAGWTKVEEKKTEPKPNAFTSRNNSGY